MRYDTVVIGSGSGGLTAAVALARAGQKVLVCEQHEIPGGWTHSFTMEGYKFSTGVHYIGELGRGGYLRAIYEGLDVSKDLEFLELNPDGYDHVFIAEERFDIPKHRRKYIRRLKDRFPHEAEGIDRYFKLLNDISYGLMHINSLKRLFQYQTISQPLFQPLFGVSIQLMVVFPHKKDHVQQLINPLYQDFLFVEMDYLVQLFQYNLN